jgi:hypothetical protein
MMMLMIAGIAVLAAGLLAIVSGIPVKEFSFGNTLILAGAIGACTGAILLGLSVVVRELQNIARRLGAANPAAISRADTEPSAAGSGGQPTDSGFPFSRERPAPATPDGAEPSPSPSPGSPTPWQEEGASRDRVRGRGDTAPEPAPEPAPATKPRRNLLFSSSSRKERERTLAARTPDAAKPDPVSAPRAAPPASAPAEPAPATFEDAWPQSERTRSDALRRNRTPSTFAEPNAAAPAPERPAPAPARSEEPPPVTVLKSGVVDGMAYSLYSDGSIEAQRPEGLKRFASIDELKAYIEGSGDPLK